MYSQVKFAETQVLPWAKYVVEFASPRQTKAKPQVRKTARIEVHCDERGV
jgi:hypothetical protein